MATKEQVVAQVVDIEKPENSCHAGYITNISPKRMGQTDVLEVTVQDNNASARVFYLKQDDAPVCARMKNLMPIVEATCAAAPA